MHAAKALVHQPSPSDGEQKPAGSDKVSVEHFEERKHRRRENHAYNPARADGAFKCNRGHEFFMGELLPRSHKSNRRNYDGVKENANHNRHPDRLEKTARA